MTHLAGGDASPAGAAASPRPYGAPRDHQAPVAGPTAARVRTTGSGGTAGTGVSGTGDARVDAAIARLAELDERSSSAAVEIYDDVHRTLAEVLGDAAVTSRGTAARGSTRSGSTG